MNFEEFINIVYLLKLLYETDIGIFQRTVDLNDMRFVPDEGYYYDSFYETAYEISESLFEYTRGDYYDRHGISITVFSDPLIEEYFRLAGEYGKANGIAEAENPYFAQADEEMRRNFNFSYSMDWILKGYAEAKRPYQSRFALLIYEDGYVDICGVAVGLLRMYRFFKENVQEITEMLAGKEEQAA